MLVVAQETAAPAWLPALFLLIPVAIMAAVGIPAIRGRRRQARVRRSPLAQATGTVARGSAATIADGGQVAWEDLLAALATKPESHGPTADGMPHDEGWMATMLGLRSKLASGTAEGAEAHFFWGERAGGQVFLRLGADEKAEGSMLLSNRVLRQVTVVRAGFDAFELAGEDGRLTSVGGTQPPPPAAGAVLASLADAPDVWDRLRVVAGPEGIVANRPLLDHGVNGWVYDLWLLERLARATGAAPLAPRRIGPAWKAPYGAGRRR